MNFLRLGACAAVLAALTFGATAVADEMSDSAARLKIGQEALAATPAPDFAKAYQYCDAAIGGLPAKASAASDMLTADATECAAKALIGQSKNQDACDMLYPVIDMIGVSDAPGKADAKARLKAVLDSEVTAKRCKP